VGSTKEEYICALYLVRTYQLMDKCHFFKRQNIFPLFFVIAKNVTLEIFFLFVTEEKFSINSLEDFNQIFLFCSIGDSDLNDIILTKNIFKNFLTAFTKDG